MISLDSVSKSYKLKNGDEKIIVKDLSIELPRRNIAILGRNGMGKSTLLRMIAGIEQTDKGTITRRCNISWPIGFGGSFHRELTGIENVRFAARIYGQDTEYVISYVKDFAELGSFFYEPVKKYSSGMVARLAFGASMAVRFDCYLIDEVMAVGDARFKKKSKSVFKEKLAASKIIMVSHGMNALREYCDCGVLIHDGKMQYYDELEAAIEEYDRINSV